MKRKRDIKEIVEAAKSLLSEEPEGAAWVVMMEIGSFVNFSDISRHYFGKSDNWLLQRLRGYRVNGKPAALKPNEVLQLADALDDMAARLHVSANRLRAAAPAPAATTNE